jgi:hypothetical protein
MSTLTQVEQATPSTPSANQQLLYPKAGALARMASDGIERKIIDTTSASNTVSAVDACSNYLNFGGL